VRPRVRMLRQPKTILGNKTDLKSKPIPEIVPNNHGARIGASCPALSEVALKWSGRWESKIPLAS
jgi:hypothetical protein